MAVPSRNTKPIQEFRATNNIEKSHIDSTGVLTVFRSTETLVFKKAVGNF